MSIVIKRTIANSPIVFSISFTSKCVVPISTRFIDFNAILDYNVTDV